MRKAADPIRQAQGRLRSYYGKSWSKKDRKLMPRRAQSRWSA